jgi:hypothetical protein
MARNIIGPLLAAATVAFVLAVHATDSRTITAFSPQELHPSGSLRLYVFDCGILHNSDAARYNFKKEEVATLEMSVACFLIAHPKGTLIWDTGAVPDSAWTPARSPTTQHVVLPDGQQRNITVVKSLKGQLAEPG